METKNRSIFVDMIKGLAIFLMLWGHCIQCCIYGSGLDFFENGVFKVIYSFHMPLFMLVSGYLFYFSFTKRELRELLVHRTQSLLQPLLFGTAFGYFLGYAFFAAQTGDYSLFFNGQFITQKLASSLLWFLWSVLACSLAVSIICKKCSKLWLQILLLIAVIPILAMFPNWDMNLYMYPYFLAGFFFAKYKDKIPAVLMKLKYVSLPLFPFLMLFYEKKHYIYTTSLLPGDAFTKAEMAGINTFRWMIGFVGSVFVITVLEFLYKRMLYDMYVPAWGRGLAKMGEKSMQIYVISVAFLSLYLPKYFREMLNAWGTGNIFAKNAFVYNFIFTLALAVAYSFAMYYLTKLLEKTKISKILFGK